MALDLDARRRAMLQEMGIVVWLPPAAETPEPGAPGASPARTARAAPDRAGAVPPAHPSAGPAPAAPPAMPARDDGLRRTVPAAVPAGRADTAPRTVAAAPAVSAPAVRADAAPGGSASGVAEPSRRAGGGPAASIGAWQVLHDGAPRPAPVRAADEGADDAPAPPAPPPLRTWLLLTESSTPADLCDAQDPAGRLLAAMLRAVQHGGPVRIVGAPVLPAAAAGDVPGDASAGGLADALREAVAQHRPALVLVLGRLASQAVLGTREPLGRLRGRLHADHPAGAPVVATYDAGYLLRAPADKARAWADLCLGLEQGGPPAAS